MYTAVQLHNMQPNQIFLLAKGIHNVKKCHTSILYEMIFQFTFGHFKGDLLNLPHLTNGYTQLFRAQAKV